MDSLSLLNRARAAGLSIRIKDNTLIVRGPRRAESIAKELLAHKQDIMRYFQNPPAVWEGTTEEYSRLLVFKQVELEALKASLSGNPTIDWYAQNVILNLEFQISDLMTRLVETDINKEQETN